MIFAWQNFAALGKIRSRENAKQTSQAALGRPRANLPDGFAESYETFLKGGYGNVSRAAFPKRLGLGAVRYISISDCTKNFRGFKRKLL
jgi:hypothetical protein